MTLTVDVQGGKSHSGRNGLPSLWKLIDSLPKKCWPRILRGDCENNFDEYKNQWGWSGFVTQKLKPTRAMARLIAIVANWWNVFCRLANGKNTWSP